jgi:hypothetical protein
MRPQTRDELSDDVDNDDDNDDNNDDNARRDPIRAYSIVMTSRKS